MTESTHHNRFLEGPLGMVFLKTAMPIIFMMLVSGSFSLVDAYFLGILVSTDALTAVTSMFPLLMLMVALSTLVATGFASVMARLLGGKKFTEAQQAFAQASTLAVLISTVLIALFFLFGEALTLAANNGSKPLAAMGYTYMAISIYASPVMFVLAVNSASLRSEGYVSFMAIVSVLSILLNLLANYLLITEWSMGVAGAAWGSVMAESLSLLAIFAFRKLRPQATPLPVLQLTRQREHWREYLALGAPSSLGYIGLALTSAATLFNLQIYNPSDYATTVSAYGILTRIMTFVFLPMLGLSMAFQSIAGNTLGAKALERTNRSIGIALVVALVYCVFVQALLWTLKNSLGAWFVDNPEVINELSRILPIVTAALFLFGPIMIISMFFQSLGDALRAGILGLSKTYLFALPLIFILPQYFGEQGIWYAGPTAEIMAFLLTAAVLFQRSRQRYILGLFFTTAH